MDPNQVTQLLDLQLVPFAPLVAIFVESILSAFTGDTRTWTPPAWAKAVLLLGLSFGLAGAKASIAPLSEHTLAGLWWVQGMTFFVATILTHKAMQAAYATPAANQATTVALSTNVALSDLSAKEVARVAEAAGIAARKMPPGTLGLLVAAVLALSLAAPARADVFSVLSSRRLSAGVAAQAVIDQNDSTGACSIGFAPKVAADYGLTAMLDLGLGAQADFAGARALEFPPPHGMAFLAARDCLNPDGEAGPRKLWHLYAGADVRHYFGKQDAGPRNVAAVVLQGAWAASRRHDPVTGAETSTRLFLTVSADKEIQRGRSHARIGLQYQGLGGK